MSPHIHLLITTLSYIISMIVVLGFGFFVFFQKNRKPLYTVWLLFCISMALYQLAFIVGINTETTSKFAYWIWYSNIAEDILIGLFTVHIFILATDGLNKFKNLLKTMYVIGFLIITASIMSPTSFVPSVTPKSYFLSYVDSSGPLYTLVFAYFLLSFIVSYFVLFYQRSQHYIDVKKRIDYYIAGLTFGLITGITAFGPDFNLPIDPGISALVGLFTVPLVYGMIKKGLMDIRIVIKKAVLITSLIIFVAIIFTTVSLLSNWLTINIPGFKTWTIPFVSALILVIVGFLYYRKEKEAEELKYEFITIMAHKFRTPLTHIRWQTEKLSDEELSPETQTEINRIKESTIELISLSNLLINASRTKQEEYYYSSTAIALPKIVNDILESTKKDISSKEIKLSVKIEDYLPLVYGDENRLSSAIRVLIENAIAYTKISGFIEIKIISKEDIVRFSIKDSGIGISKKDQDRVFSGLYRGTQARLADTEGIGLGLSMAKKIIERQGGSMGVESEGEGKGSTFWLTIPSQKK